MFNASFKLQRHAQQAFVFALLSVVGTAWGQQQPREAGRALDGNLNKSAYRDGRDPSGGRGLERDLRVGGTGNYRPSSFEAEVAYRNAVVTGNATGGKSFRGDVGYRAADEFRGSLGSDDTFAFRRDSVSSGMFGRGLRGTESVQFQYSYATGNNKVMSRMDGSASSDAPLSGKAKPAENKNASADMGTMRSTSAYATARALTPQVVGVRRTPIGLEQTTASNLMGVRTYMLPTEAPPTRSPSSLTSSASLPSAAAPAGAERIDNSFKTSYSELVERLSARPLAPGTKPEDATSEDGKPTDALPKNTDTPTGTDSNLTTPAPGDANKPPAGTATPGTTTPGGTTPGSATPSGTATPDATPVAPEWRRRIDTLRDGWMKNREAPPVLEDQAGEVDPRTGKVPKYRIAQIDPEVAELIRSSGGVVSAFAVGSPGTSEAFADHLRAGQELLAAERFFDAEERFARALSYRPGETTAQVGRAHAQIGAGLLLSAAINLHTLFLENPEMIAVRYSGGTFPPAERLGQVVGNLRKDIAKTAKLKLDAPQDAAFMLAYIGYQTDDRAMIREGLDLLTAPQNQADAELTAFLEKVWLAEGPLAPTFSPNPTPTSVPAPEPVPVDPVSPVDPGK